MTTTSEFTPPPDLVLSQQANRRGRGHLIAVPDLPESALPVLETDVLEDWVSHDGENTRIHEVQRVTMPDGRNHKLLHTEPAGDETGDIAIVNMLGWTESIGGVLIRKTHRHLSHELPDFSIDTHATYGTDGTLARFSPREIGRLSLDHVAERTFDTLVPLYENKRTVIVATSMGAAILARLEVLNEAEGSPLDIAGRVLYEPCLVAPEHGGVALLSRFAVHLSRNALAELVEHNPPKEALQLIYDTIQSLPPISDGPAIVRLGLSLLGGTSHDLLHNLASYKPKLIQGTKDILREPVFEAHPEVSRKAVQGKGHCMGGDARKRAAAIAKEIRTIQTDLYD